jgi:hypothetical protein
MPFSASEKQLIRNYLGFSELFHDLDPRLEGQMADIGDRSPEAVTFVQGILAKLATVDAQLDTLLSRLSIIRAEDIEFLPGQQQLEAARDRGRELVQKIAIVFEIKPKRDVYAGGEDLDGGILPLG